MTINLDKRVCPGCGLVNPTSLDSKAFECKRCGWTDEEVTTGQMPTIRAIKSKRSYKCAGGDVDLSAFLRAIIGEEAEGENHD